MISSNDGDHHPTPTNGTGDQRRTDTENSGRPDAGLIQPAPGRHARNE